MGASGPLFDGRAEELLTEAIRKMRKDVADEGKRLVQAALASSIRVETTGRAIADVTVIESSRTFSTSSRHHSYTLAVGVPAETDVVTTSLASYGPWLVGEGSKNATSRFAGYHSFRIAAGELDGRGRDIADRALKPYVERMR